MVSLLLAPARFALLSRLRCSTPGSTERLCLGTSCRNRLLRLEKRNSTGFKRRRNILSDGCDFTRAKPRQKQGRLPRGTAAWPEFQTRECVLILHLPGSRWQSECSFGRAPPKSSDVPDTESTETEVRCMECNIARTSLLNRWRLRIAQLCRRGCDRLCVDHLTETDEADALRLA